MGIERSRRDILPASLAPRGLSRAEAAAYIGISPCLFDAMIRDGRMPPAKCINARKVWDRKKLDAAFEELPEPQNSGSADMSDPWASVAV